MPKPAAPILDKQTILDELDDDVTRIQVIDEFKKTRFRKIDEVADKDEIVLNAAGKPVVMTGAPGRKKKPEPLAPRSSAIAELVEAKKEHLKDDALLTVIKANPEASKVLDFVMSGLAEESASLAFERNEAERNGQPTSQISMRRIGALKAVGDSWLKRKEQIASNGVDMDSPAFQRLFSYIMDTFKQALESAGTRPEMIETVFAGFSKKVADDEWSREATKRMTDG